MSQAEATRPESIDQERRDDDKKPKSRRPASESSLIPLLHTHPLNRLDTAFRQQRLKAWQ